MHASHFGYVCFGGVHIHVHAELLGAGSRILLGSLFSVLVSFWGQQAIPQPSCALGEEIVLIYLFKFAFSSVLILGMRRSLGLKYLRMSLFFSRWLSLEYAFMLK